MIGDNLDADIKGAINAGMDSIFVNHINADLKGIKPTYVITHLKELEGIFEFVVVNSEKPVVSGVPKV
jgi:putative hydrolase of the HAD superfamily